MESHRHQMLLRRLHLRSGEALSEIPLARNRGRSPEATPPMPSSNFCVGLLQSSRYCHHRGTLAVVRGHVLVCSLERQIAMLHALFRHTRT